MLPALLTLALFGSGEDVRVAVAANYQSQAGGLARRFQERTGHRVLLSVGSTGKLYAQIRNGAPFDVFLAADERRPALLMQDGKGLDRFTYAMGRLVLLGGEGPEALDRADVKHIAIANPETAPYGAAARETLRRLGHWPRLKDRLVFGESVGQTFQFVRSGNAELGFVARSQITVENVWLVPAELHDPIRQDIVLLSDREVARAFFDFVRAEGIHDPATAGSSTDLAPVWLTLKLALTTTLVLLLLGTPLAWWLARGRSRWRVVIEAVTALPLVLPPTVLGFYLLVLLGPQGMVGGFWESLGFARLVFSFPGLLVGSVLFSLPFVVQPLQNSFQSIDERYLDAASTLRASPLDRFFSVAVPLARPGILTAAVLGFAHTVGEFGVVLMIGGSIPGRTRVLSIAIYEHVEKLEYGHAHLLAGGMLIFSFLVLLVVYAVNRRFERVTA